MILNGSTTEEIMSKIPVKTIYSTVGVYADGSRVINAVASSDLKSHIDYNKSLRPGRALFLEGICLNSGYLSSQFIARLEKEFAEHPHNPEEVSTPYR